MNTTDTEPKPPAIIARVIIPEQFIHWVGNRLFGRGYDLIEPALIAFIFQEAIDREFASNGTKIDHDADDRSGDRTIRVRPGAALRRTRAAHRRNPSLIATPSRPCGPYPAGRANSYPICAFVQHPSPPDRGLTS